MSATTESTPLVVAETTTSTASTKATAKATTTTSATNPTNIWIYICYGTIIVLWIVSRIIIVPYVIHLLVLVTCILYVACHMSLVLREVPHPDEKDVNGNPLPIEIRETMKKEDAMSFPIIGSISLFSLYLAFKYLNKDWVNFLIGFYFGLVGCIAITMTFAPAIDTIICKLFPNKALDTDNATTTTSTTTDNDTNTKAASATKSSNFLTTTDNDTNTKAASTTKSSHFLIDFEYKKEHTLPEFILGPSPFEISIQISTAEFISFILSIGICSTYYIRKRPWYINNILGICFCLQGIEKFSLGTYKIGAILLVGLFFYDIFWVFGTDVMVTVAKNLDGPIKILFPRSRTSDGKLELSLLGLGDIVIPGFFLSLLLRFDAHMANVSVHYINVHENFAKPYFHTALAAYVIGLGTTLFVMVYFQAAQPALLYLVPACLGSSLLCALVRGELKDLFDYSEEQLEEEESEEEEDADKKEPVKEVQAKKDD